MTTDPAPPDRSRPDRITPDRITPDRSRPDRSTPDRSAPDRITLRGLRVFGYHGVLEAERREGQDFIIDATLWLPTAPAAATDDLARTADYAALAARLAAVVAGPPVRLIETLAQRLAEAALAEPLAREVEITVHKPSAPMEAQFEDVSVTIRRPAPLPGTAR